MKLSDLRIESAFDCFDVKFATSKEIEKFKKDVFDVDNIFIFYHYPARICKYLNIIGSISQWGEILHTYEPDFVLPLYFYWHYYRKGEKIKYDDIFEKQIGNPKIEKFKEIFIKQFYVAFMAFLEKLKRAYANIYNFSYHNFKKQKFNIHDRIFLRSGLKDELLSYLKAITEFENCEEFTRFRKLRNSSVHNIGGKKVIVTFEAQNDDDFLREMKITKEHISDNQFVELLRFLLPRLDYLCSLFNTINFKYFRYLVQFDMPGKIVDLK